MMEALGAVLFVRDRHALVDSFSGWVGKYTHRFYRMGYTLLGIRNSALAKSFFVIRLAHIADGYEDLSLRAHRVETVIKAIKLRGKTC